MKRLIYKGLVGIVGAATLNCCATTIPPDRSIPSLEYSDRIHAQMNDKTAASSHSAKQRASMQAAAMYPVANLTFQQKDRAELRLVSDEGGKQEDFAAKVEAPKEPVLDGNKDVVTNIDPNAPSGLSNEPKIFIHTSKDPLVRDYIGPLSLGDPGVSASLWRESKNGNDFFRDDRAWQPMDLITITVSEQSQGSKKANTEVKSKTTVEAAISKLLGLETFAKDRNASLDPTALVKASTQNDFKGEGDTKREGSLKAKISAMVVEVLPSGILRIEGKKVISVNSEDEVMVISGLVRTQDIDSSNEVDSSKVANMRIDYYGTGTVGDAQHGGWLGRLLKRFWPL